MSLAPSRELLRAAVAVALAAGVAAVSAFQGGQFPPLGTGISDDEKVALQLLVDGLSSKVGALKRRHTSGPLADRIADVEVYSMPCADR